ncbi:MAG: hypothetical protein LBE36_07905 [Flavobacteriaceae bacterium]|jgi:lantibiotic modifying enzyme|nr:hypothetical protein [Flavobacteriaceae bacterium]
MEKKKLLEQIIKIEETINNNWEKENLTVSLMTGLGGILLFYAKLLEIFPENEKYQKNINKIIDNLFFKLNSSQYNLFYCEGITGVSFVLYLLKKHPVFEKIETQSFHKDIDSLLYSHLKQDVLEIEQADFLHGNLGIINYFINFNKYRLLEKSKKTIDLIEKYVSSIELTPDNSVLINFGLSHGLASYLMILSKLFDFTQNSYYKSLIEKILNIYLYFEELNSENCVFPNMLYNENDIRTKINLGWCYGDQTISYAIYRSSISIGDKLWIDKSIIYAEKWAERNTIEKALLTPYDYMFCHGVASVAYLNKKWYNITDNVIFLNNYNFFLSKIDEHGYVGYKRFNEPIKDYDMCISLLDGIAGIGLLFIDDFLQHDNTIDKIFLLD